MGDGPGVLGKSLIALGLAIAAVGVIIMLLGRFPSLRIGRLPGDIYIERENFRFYFPLATSIILSIVLSLLLWFFRRR
ncbi:MAG TPA: DUF2905 domain-containing protein [Blastocatellia bacterium]|nr:DUF2905 domain-containing protein [Blastocatellia bacterium]